MFRVKFAFTQKELNRDLSGVPTIRRTAKRWVVYWPWYGRPTQYKTKSRALSECESQMPMRRLQALVNEMTFVKRIQREYDALFRVS